LNPRPSPTSRRASVNGVREPCGRIRPPFRRPLSIPRTIVMV
jgi:hypothetical protein